MSVHPISGWGYEGRSVEDLVARACRDGGATVVDVRLTPISRKRGFSKRALAERLKSCGIEYIHLPGLGNPRDNREGFASPTAPAGVEAHERFNREVLSSPDAVDALAELERLSEDRPVILLCFEADGACCHRSLVIAWIEEHRSALV